MQDEQGQETGDDDGGVLGVGDEATEGKGAVPPQAQRDQVQLLSDGHPLVQVDGLDAGIRGPGEGPHRQAGELGGVDGGHEAGQQRGELGGQAHDAGVAARGGGGHVGQPA